MEVEDCGAVLADALVAACLSLWVVATDGVKKIKIIIEKNMHQGFSPT